MTETAIHDKSEITTQNCRSRPALLYVLRHTDTLELFVRFCTSQHNEENVLFWIAVRDFKALPAFDSAGLQTQAASIVNKFIASGCDKEINLSESSRAALVARIAPGATPGVDQGMFDPMIAAAEKEMAGDILPRFIKSPAWRTLCDPGRQVSPPVTPAPPSLPTSPAPLSPTPLSIDPSRSSLPSTTPSTPEQHTPTNFREILSAHARSKTALGLVLHDPLALESFVAFCKSQHNEENILFWVAARDFKVAGDADRPAIGMEVFRKFIGPDCELEVNLDAKSKAALSARVASNDYPPDLFDSVVTTVEKELAGDVLPRFVKSAAWRALLATAGAMRQTAVPPTLPPPIVTAPASSPSPLPAATPSPSASTAQTAAGTVDPAPSPAPVSAGGSRNSPKTPRGSSPSLFGRPRLVSVEKPLLSKADITADTCRSIAALRLVLVNDDTKASFDKYCTKHKCDVNLLAWRGIGVMKAVPASDVAQLVHEAKQFSVLFLDAAGHHTLKGIDEGLMSALEQRISRGDVSPTMCDDLLTAVETAMAENELQGYFASHEWTSVGGVAIGGETRDERSRSRSGSLRGLFGAKLHIDTASSNSPTPKPIPMPASDPVTPSASTPAATPTTTDVPSAVVAHETVIRTKKDITAQNCRSKPALLFVLGNPDTLASFIAFATSQHCQENVLVWSAIKTFRDASEREPESMLPRAKEIVDRYIGPNCELEVNLDAASKAVLVAKVASNEADISMFDKLQAVLEKEMAGDLLPRFVKSPAWAALLRLDSEIDGDSIKHTDSPTTPSGGMLSGLFKSKKAPAPPTSPPPVSITIDRVALSNTLRRAALLGNAALVATTINNGANVNDADPNGFTALHAAACGGDVTTVRLLLRKGGDVNVVDKAGDTPLLYACIKNHIRVVEELKKAGADLSVRGMDGLHGGQIAEREGFRDIARFFRASGLIGNMNLTSGVKLESTLMVADGSSGDKWQPRVFFLSDLMKALVFWSGTKTDIHGTVSQIPFHCVTRVYRPTKYEPTIFSLKVSSGRVLAVMANDSSEAKEWTEAVFQATRLHMASFKIQTAVRRMFAYRAARRRRRQFVHAIRLIRSNAENESGPVMHFTNTKALGLFKTVKFTRRFLVLWRSECQLRSYKSRAAFEAFKPPLVTYDLKSFASIHVDVEENILEIRQWKGSRIRFRMEYDDDMTKWTTVLQSVLPTLNIASTIIQAAWRRYKARVALPYLRARSLAIKLSRKYGVSTVVLHAAANRIRKGWRNALWHTILNRRIFKNRRGTKRRSKLLSVVSEDSSVPEPQTLPSLQDAVMGAVGDASEGEFLAKQTALLEQLKRKQATSPRSPLFADADDWFEKQLRSIKFTGLKPNSGSSSPASMHGRRTPTEVDSPANALNDPDVIQSLTELMKLDLLRRLAPRRHSITSQSSSMSGRSTPKGPGAPFSDSQSIDAAGAPVASSESEPKDEGDEISKALRERNRRPHAASTASSTSLGILKDDEKPEDLLSLPVTEILRRYMSSVTGQDVDFKPGSASRQVRAAAMAAMVPLSYADGNATPVSRKQSAAVIETTANQRPSHQASWRITGATPSFRTHGAVGFSASQPPASAALVGSVRTASPPKVSDRRLTNVEFFKKKSPSSGSVKRVQSSEGKAGDGSTPKDGSDGEEEEDDETNEKSVKESVYVQSWDAAVKSTARKASAPLNRIKSYGGGSRLLAAASARNLAASNRTSSFAGSGVVSSASVATSSVPEVVSSGEDDDSDADDATFSDSEDEEADEALIREATGAPPPQIHTNPTPSDPLTKQDITTRNCRTRGALLFVLGQPDCAAAFEAFCRAEHSEEAVLCWNAIKVFKALVAAGDPAAHAVHAAILKAHFLDDCPHEVSVSAALKLSVVSSDVHPGIFDDVQAVLEKEMAGDILPRFIKSPAWTAVLNPVATPQTPEIPRRQFAATSPVHVGADPGPIHITRKEDITSQNCCRGAALRYVLHHDDCLRAMVALSQRQFNEENVLCWLAIEDYKRAAVMDETGAMVARARDVIQRFVADECELEVTWDAESRSKLTSAVNLGAISVFTPQLFDALQRNVEKQMSVDSMPRFVRSKEWRELCHRDTIEASDADSGSSNSVLSSLFGSGKRRGRSRSNSTESEPPPPRSSSVPLSPGSRTSGIHITASPRRRFNDPAAGLSINRYGDVSKQSVIPALDLAPPLIASSSSMHSTHAQSALTLMDVSASNCRSRAALMCVLSHSRALTAFLQFCKQQHCEENLLAWMDVSAFKRAPASGRLTIAQSFADKFLSSRTQYELNVSAALKARILAEISRGEVSVDMLDPILNAAEKEMAGDFMFRFIKSPAWQALLSSEPVLLQPPVSPVVTPLPGQQRIVEPIAMPPLSSPITPFVSTDDRQASLSSALPGPSLPTSSVTFTMASDITPQNCRTKQALLFVLLNPELKAAFHVFCKQQHCDENVIVWEVINSLKTATDVDRLLIGNELIDKYIGPAAVMEVNVDPRTKADVLDGLSAGFLPATVCDKWQATLEKEMAGDIMPRFVASAAWKALTQPPVPSPSPPISHERLSVLQRIATWKARGVRPSTASDSAYDRLRLLQVLKRFVRNLTGRRPESVSVKSQTRKVLRQNRKIISKTPLVIPPPPPRSVPTTMNPLHAARLPPPALASQSQAHLQAYFPKSKPLPPPGSSTVHKAVKASVTNPAAPRPGHRTMIKLVQRTSDDTDDAPASPVVTTK